MRPFLATALLLAAAGPSWAHGLLIPEDKSLPPLAMLNHHVRVNVADQLTTTRVEQTFRNHTPRPLEATYVFPVPKGASVTKLTMWIDGKETKGEILPAKDAKATYQSIVRRTQDPALLEYIGSDLLQLKVFPIPANSDQKVAFEFSAVAAKEGNLVEFVYPLKTDGKATATLDAFSIKATLTSQHGIGNVYSPTHAVAVKRTSDKAVEVEFEKNQAMLDKDFQLFYSLTDSDVGLTTLTHRPVGAEPGYISLLITPKMDRSKIAQVGQDVVLVMDTSGSMRGVKMDQARKALRYCLNQLGAKDRFTVVQFATTVNRYRDSLVAADADQVKAATKWVDDLDASGGTAINEALKSALALRPEMTEENRRPFTVVFFTDGQPTIGETNAEKIVKAVGDANTANTRLFTFGVGDDVNASMLDRIAENSRALSSYVRPAEDIEAKVSGLYAKMTNPVLTDLKLTTTGDVRVSDIYPAALPDLFWGGQLVVFGRYTGSGATAVKLEGRVGSEKKEFVYEVTLAEKTDDRKDFVEGLWARRKVGYLLDQIRANGEKKELVDEVTTLAKRYGITTPYTSWLVVPDGVMPVAQGGRNRELEKAGRAAMPDVSFTGGFNGGSKGIAPAALQAPPGRPAAEQQKLLDFLKNTSAVPQGNTGYRMTFEEGKVKNLPADPNLEQDEVIKRLKEAQARNWNYQQYAQNAFRGDNLRNQAGQLGVDLSLNMQHLRGQDRQEWTALRRVAERNVLEVGGVWIDDAYNTKMESVVVKAMSDAYFRLLEKQPKLVEVFRLSNHLVFVTPSGKALVIDTKDGVETLKDEEIDTLFAPKK